MLVGVSLVGLRAGRFTGGDVGHVAVVDAGKIRMEGMVVREREEG
jgi:hypothetical protein